MSVNSEIPRLNPLGQVALGGISSLSINGIVHPISTIQNCMMANPQLTLRMLAKNMRFVSLYRGFWAIFATDTAAFSAAYMTNDLFSRRFSEPTSAIDAGVACAPIFCIGEGFVRNRQVNGMPYSDIMKRAIRLEGFVTTAVREIPFTAAVFWLPSVLEKKMSDSSSVGTQVFIGSIAGCVAGLATSPIDLIKTRVQTNEQQLTIINVIRSIYAEKGWQGFFRGGGMRFICTGLAVAGMVLVKNVVPYGLSKNLQEKE